MIELFSVEFGSPVIANKASSIWTQKYIVIMPIIIK